MNFFKKNHKFIKATKILMSKKVIVSLFFSVITMYSYAQEEKTYWDNGNLKSVTNYSDGKKNGIWNTYYEDGNRKEQGRYDNGKKGGTWREYYFNGETKRIRQFSNDVILGYTAYHFNGRIMVVGTFDENGKKNGNWEQFYENGYSKLNGEYNHGVKQGKWKFFLVNGNIYKIENYTTGVKTSKWEMNDDDKNRLDTSVDKYRVYNDDRLNGEWKFYNESGKCIEIGNFKNDKKDGEWTYYFDNGQIEKVQLWDDGNLMEIISYVDNKGVSLDKGRLKNGTGTVKEYNAQGEVTAIEYANGKILDWDDYSTLNSLAWNVYEVENDKEKIANAIVWVKRSIELDKNYYNTDTYAALLYKIGEYDKALLIAQEAIEIAKKYNDDFSATVKLIESIHMDLKKTGKK